MATVREATAEVAAELKTTNETVKTLPSGALVSTHP